MTDLDRAIAAAREALAKYQDREVRHYLDEAMEGLLAALDAARGEAVAWQVNAYGVCQKIVRREDVADELADSYRRSNYENVEVVPLFAAPSALQAELDHARRRIGELTIQLGEAMKVPPAALAVPKLEHKASADCWCEPELDSVDPDTGAKVWVHREAH